MRPLSADPRYPRPPQAARRGPVVAPQKQHAPKPPRRAAPSRLAFRLERLWLTPFVRLVTRIGLPVFCVTLGLGLWLGDAGRRADLIERYLIVKTQIQNRPEFRISTLDVAGASAEVEGAVRALLPVGLPASRFAIDLDAYRAAIRRLDAVESVAIVVQSGGTLEVRVQERTPVILWRTARGIEMLDMTGHRTASLTRRDARPDLPLIAGQGADKAVPEALAILAAAKPILPRARGLVRVGERRWDLVLDRDQRILLPEDNPVRAVQRTLALDTAEDLLSRDFTRLDLRNETRPTIRLSSAALDALHDAKGITSAKASP
ncbi:cell division protein FtsQ [Rhodobacter sp. TJ_12]|uniref:cell division protein FtsQ/DivIB n=1 Tax=Rhodobacter sp. TJ_12 TaxID=2029399 RepID=UPI001CBFC397|nr:cell division protein FtsQ/DivIB [Rhodobacter sp. TJ_12]MBZ4021833.1 cell division protein FtsQ [Rhodobacter sp. TJ_12]